MCIHFTASSAHSDDPQEYAMKSLLRPIMRCLGILAVIISPAWVDAQVPVVGKAAEWAPSSRTIEVIRQECDRKKGPDFGACFVDSMGRAGASPEAAAFARATGNTGYLAHLLERGRVDLAYVQYPFRANENQGWILVNGAPAMIDVDSLGELPKRQLAENPVYLSLKEKFPNIMLFGGDRDVAKPPEMLVLPTKGQRFVVEYRLLNGCHACERIGGARFAFDFAPDGTFLGSTLLDVQ
jgi:hypothetical protein